ncbi:MAG: regulatory protein TetR [Acidimicrobiales bacterium]|nr:regulatory protein TetR [Acidimicrobiales bacterium]
MRRSTDQNVSVADILAEAGIATRSFYRHFSSRDELICAMFRNDAEHAAIVLRDRIASVASPGEQLVAWIDEILSFRHEGAKERRVAALGSAAVMRVEGYAEEAARASTLLTEPLVALLQAGRDDGSFPTCDPASDASLIRAMVWDAAGLTAGRRPGLSRQEAHDRLLSFCRRALGVAQPTDR